jgi:G2/mitotic-specific cyclin-B, other
MLDKEELYSVDFEYLQKSQTEVKDTSRGFLVEWIIDVHRKFRLQPETLYVTVSTIDRYLSKVSIKKTQLHLLGVAALLIATKYEEIYPPDLKDLLNVSENKFTKEEVLKLENDILSTLEFNFFVPSLLRFL